jgi:hypothetical protein
MEGAGENAVHARGQGVPGRANIVHGRGRLGERKGGPVMAFAKSMLLFTAILLALFIVCFRVIPYLVYLAIFRERD